MPCCLAARARIFGTQCRPAFAPWCAVSWSTARHCASGIASKDLMTGSPRTVRDRDVVLLLAAVVIGVLAINLVSGLVPGLDQLLASAPPPP